MSESHQEAQETQDTRGPVIVTRVPCKGTDSMSVSRQRRDLK
jgi:hypothetical protein